jgi:hypothetical protein
VVWVSGELANRRQTWPNVRTKTSFGNLGNLGNELPWIVIPRPGSDGVQVLERIRYPCLG